MRRVRFIGCFTLGVVMLLGFSIGAVQAGPCELPEFNPGNFNNSLTIDNPYFPLTPGTTFVYEPRPNEDNVVNTMTVTNDTKNVAGVDCVVVYDVVTEDGLMTEETYDWYAQDDDGNVWYFGEATVSYQYDADGNLIGTSTEGSWEAGVDGALPGYIMLAEPMPGICYQQEYYEGEAEDMAEVQGLNAIVSVEYGDFNNCLVTKEWTPLEPGIFELKYYAQGTGLVLIEEENGTVRVELIKIIAPKGIPAMTGWGMVAFVVIVGLTSIYCLRRRKTAE